MSFQARIDQDLKDAMTARDAGRLRVIGMLKAAVMKLANKRAAGRAEGRALSSAVSAALA